MKNNRRNFLKIAGISALGLTTIPVLNAYAIGEHFADDSKISKNPNAKKSQLKGKNLPIKWGMVIDTRELDKNPGVVEKMEHECHRIHNVPDLETKNHEIKWIWGEEFKHAFPGKENEYIAEKFRHMDIPILCNHCENPACVRACPTKATFKRDDGIVLMDFHRCIGCRFCMAACPYGSRSFNFIDPRKDEKLPVNKKFPTRMKGVVEKCNFCAERLAVGEEPACAKVSNGAIVTGDLNDEKSPVRKLLKSNYTIRRKQGLGTGPSVYYIV